MKKTFIYLFAGFMLVMPSALTIALVIKGHEWDKHQMFLMAFLIVCGLFAVFIVLAANRTKKKQLRVQSPARDERSNLFVMPYGDELLFTDGNEIIAHLPNNNLPND